MRLAPTAVPAAAEHQTNSYGYERSNFCAQEDALAFGLGLFGSLRLKPPDIGLAAIDDFLERGDHPWIMREAHDFLELLNARAHVRDHFFVHRGQIVRRINSCHPL